MWVTPERPASLARQSSVSARSTATCCAFFPPSIGGRRERPTISQSPSRSKWSITARPTRPEAPATRSLPVIANPNSWATLPPISPAPTGETSSLGGRCARYDGSSHDSWLCVESRDRRIGERIGDNVEQRHAAASYRVVERRSKLSGIRDSLPIAVASTRDRRVIDRRKGAGVGVVAEKQILGMSLIA